MSLVVNGEYIDDALVREEANRIKPQLVAVTPEEDQLSREMRVRDWARENVIERVLLRQAALNDPVPTRPELFDTDIDCLGSRSSGKSVSTFTSRQDLQRERDISLRIERFVSKVTKTVALPKSMEIADYYRKHRDRFYAPEMVHCAHIVKNVDERTNEICARAAIATAWNALQKGRPFERVTDEYSDCPGRGGDLGFFSRGEMVEEFDDVVFSLEVGQISDIFRSPFGFHIAKIYQKRRAGVRSFNEVRTEIQNLIYSQRKEEAIHSLVKDLKAKADIRRVRE